MKELVIIHQNINQNFCFYKDKKRIDTRNTPMIVAINLLEVAKVKNANVIVCTEFKVLDSYKEAIEKPLTEAGYVIFKNEELKNLDKGKVETINQVLIAIKNDIVNEQKLQINPIGLDQNDGIYSKISYGLTYGNIGETPNYLRVDLDLNGKPYSIIGTRIRLLKSGGKEERIFRAKQLNVLLSSLPKDRELIIVGDFNNSPSDDFRKQGSKWHFEEIYIKEKSISKR